MFLFRPIFNELWAENWFLPLQTTIREEAPLRSMVSFQVVIRITYWWCLQNFSFPPLFSISTVSFPGLFRTFFIEGCLPTFRTEVGFGFDRRSTVEVGNTFFGHFEVRGLRKNHSYHFINPHRERHTAVNMKFSRHTYYHFQWISTKEGGNQNLYWGRLNKIAVIHHVTWVNEIRKIAELQHHFQIIHNFT